jgi:outer membrane biosynthesis protein TonB
MCQLLLDVQAAPTQPQQQQDGQKQEAQKQGQQQNGASTSTAQQQGQANSTSTSLTSAGAKAAAAAAAGGGRDGARPWAGPKIQFPPVKADAGDGKILLLFDLNGVLTEKTPARIEGK